MKTLMLQSLGDEPRWIINVISKYERISIPSNCYERELNKCKRDSKQIYNTMLGCAKLYGCTHYVYCVDNNIVLEKDVK